MNKYFGRFGISEGWLIGIDQIQKKLLAIAAMVLDSTTLSVRRQGAATQK